MDSIKLALADDHALFRKGMISLLQTEPGFEVVLEAGNGEELVKRIEHKEVDVVLMDLEMPVMDGIEATHLLVREKPDTKVLFLSSHNEEEMILSAIQSGGKGYLLKASEPEEVFDSIQSVHKNGFYFNDNVSSLLIKGMVEKDLLNPVFYRGEVFTPRELEVLNGICHEQTNKEIAEALFLSPRTVEGYRKNMLEKIGCKNSVGLVIYALKNNLVELK